MNVVPVALSFDNNMVLPACVCLSSLMQNAGESTFYDIFVLHSRREALEKTLLDRTAEHYGNCRIQYRAVLDNFDKSFEIRNVTVSTYYRLLIPDMIPEYDKIIYSDVDVIFREDLSALYESVKFDDNTLVAGVNSLSHMIPDVRDYYEKRLKINSEATIYAGNIVINSRAMREEGIVDRFKSMASSQYRFQDMDMINIVCAGRIKYLPPKYCITTYFGYYAVHGITELREIWTDEEIEDALHSGIVHYNGQKPWKGYCVNFDIWWEYYRKSPVFDRQFYFDFFYSRLNELDSLSLWKRIKILVRYFVYGRSR